MLLNNSTLYSVVTDSKVLQSSINITKLMEVKPLIHRYFTSYLLALRQRLALLSAKCNVIHTFVGWLVSEQLFFNR